MNGKFLDFVAASPAAARWLGDARAAFPVPPGNVSAHDLHSAIQWLALTGAVPIATVTFEEEDGGKYERRIVPDCKPDLLQMQVNTRRSVLRYRDAEEAPVFIWVLPLPPENDTEMRYMTPIGVAYTAHRNLTKRLQTAINAFVQRSNAPILVSTGTVSPSDPPAISPMNAFTGGVTTIARNDVPLVDYNALVDGRFVPTCNTNAGTFAVRLYGGATYSALVKEMRVPEETIHAFSRADALGMARVLSEVFSVMLDREGVRVDPAAVPRLRAKRSRRMRRTSDDESDSEDD